MEWIRMCTPWICSYVGWSVGNGSSIHLGFDPIVGMTTEFTLSDGLCDYLQDYGITRLSQDCTTDYGNHDSTGSSFYWLSTEHLDLGGV